MSAYLQWRREGEGESLKNRSYHGLGAGRALGKGGLLWGKATEGRVVMAID